MTAQKLPCHQQAQRRPPWLCPCCFPGLCTSQGMCEHRYTAFLQSKHTPQPLALWFRLNTRAPSPRQRFTPSLSTAGIVNLKRFLLLRRLPQSQGTPQCALSALTGTPPASPSPPPQAFPPANPLHSQLRVSSSWLPAQWWRIQTSQRGQRDVHNKTAQCPLVFQWEMKTAKTLDESHQNSTFLHVSDTTQGADIALDVIRI